MKKRTTIALLGILTLYVALRVPPLFWMDEFSDYDEGTYLLIARSINSGYLPYRDIFAVHPPLFYYFLALWLRIFGDNVISGRSFSLFFGALSVVLGYLIGKKLKDEITGLFLATLLALDPFLMFYNASVYQLTLIEFSFLLTLYLWLRETNDYITFFILGVLSTVKHTIIPYTLALLLVRCLNLDIKIDKKVIKAFVLAYLSLLILEILLITLYSSKLARNLLIFPGIKEGEIVGSFLPVLLLLVFFLLNLRIFNVFSFKMIMEVIKKVNIKKALLIVSTFIVGRAIIEIPLGLALSKSYFSMVYLSNSSRYVPLLNLPNLVTTILKTIIDGDLELLYPYYSILVLLFLILAKGRNSGDAKVRTLTIISALVYLLFPIPHYPRFLYPIFLLLLIYLASSLKINKWNAIIAIFLIAIFSIALLMNVPKGKLAIPFAEHTEEIRREASNIVTKLNGSVYSFNPMNAYLFDLKEPVWYIDNFGILYLQNEDPKEFIKSLNVSNIILSTWVFAIADNSPVLYEKYSAIIDYLTVNGSLLYGIAYSSGEKLLIYSLNKSSEVSFFLDSDSLVVYYNSSKLFKLKFANKTPKKIIVERIPPNTYRINVLFDKKMIARNIKILGNEIVVNDESYLEFPGDISIENSAILYRNHKIVISTAGISTLSENVVRIQGTARIKITH
ncbi:integral membrane glycosyltransferase [Pyrococcus furiosus DSM 3638]|uniref:Integral membrane glycosyltransferase n=3 Tax=Pyrococcus furiosus TaxID=2261 RepID=A0A5C0XNN1_PYRFU|nr:glycosyltransferase family 39 protein [Pyrococcus furiosus]AAL80632.1 integral membrane glycosyltransferase [Pyrococcus furiosus DSM 3638]AFN03303.1 integral membrane glycosyltransferase [Pyrococcus furiosus COM1]QEK78221.1 integral membrane glycosyltransferase [Pyrococcus furiosus DSM 3638]